MARTLIDYDLIIFDCDGVLVDSELLSCHCLTKVLARHGVEADLDTVFEKFLGRSVDAVVAHCRALGRDLPQEFRTELRQCVRQSFAASLQPVSDVAAALRGLGAAFCVASSSDLERIEFSLALTGLAALFADRVFSAQMVRHGKPAPDLFLHAASRLQVAPQRTLVIEDSVSGVMAGKAAGMAVWGFVGGSHYAGRDGKALLVAAGADRVFDAMADLRPQLARRRDGIVG